MPMKNDFIRCGVIGWCWEVTYTGLLGLTKRNFDPRLRGQTSLIMFPIYGMAALIRPIARIIKNRPLWVRGGIYMSMIYLGEYISGMFLKKRDMCPWDYSKAPYNIDGVIRLDYAPGWFALGLIYEKVLADRT